MEFKFTRKVLVLILAAVLILIAASFFINFRAAGGNTQSESIVTAYSTGIEPGQPKPPLGQLAIYVDEPTYFLGSIKQGVVKGIQDTYGIPELQVLDEVPEQIDVPVMVVTVRPTRAFWLPFYSTTTLDISVVYASDSNMEWVRNTNHMATLSQSPAIRMEGQFDIRDTSFGLMTWKGHARYLGRQAAAEILKAMETHLR